jgi:hypothetical protein
MLRAMLALSPHAAAIIDTLPLRCFAISLDIFLADTCFVAMPLPADIFNVLRH